MAEMTASTSAGPEMGIASRRTACDADSNLDQQGRFGNARQNLTPNHKTQQR